MPSAEAWAGRLGLKRVGREHVGPCPVCGGSDRFHVRDGPNGRTSWGCRGCIDGQAREAKRRATAAVLRAVWGDRRRTGGRDLDVPRSLGRANPRGRGERSAEVWRRQSGDGRFRLATPPRIPPAAGWPARGHGPLWRPYVPLSPSVRWQQVNAGARSSPDSGRSETPAKDRASDAGWSAPCLV